MDTEQDSLLQQEQPKGIPSPGRCSLNLAATAAPVPGAKTSGYYSENGYLMELSIQERRRIEQEIKERFKPGEIGQGMTSSCTVTYMYHSCIL